MAFSRFRIFKLELFLARRYCRTSGSLVWVLLSITCKFVIAGPIFLLRSYELRAFSHKPGNQASSVTGTNFVVISARPTGMKFKKQYTKMRYKYSCIVRDYRNLLDFGDIRLKWKYIQDKNYVILAVICCESEAVLSKLWSFVVVTRAWVSYGKIFIPVAEISVTGLTRSSPPKLIWTHRNFNKEIGPGNWDI